MIDRCRAPARMGNLFKIYLNDKLEINENKVWEARFSI